MRRGISGVHLCVCVIFFVGSERNFESSGATPLLLSAEVFLSSEQSWVTEILGLGKLKETEIMFLLVNIHI